MFLLLRIDPSSYFVLTECVTKSTTVVALHSSAVLLNCSSQGLQTTTTAVQNRRHQLSDGSSASKLVRFFSQAYQPPLTLRIALRFAVLQRPTSSGRRGDRVAGRGCHAYREPGASLGSCDGRGKAARKQAIAHVSVRRRCVVSLQPDQEVGDLDRWHGPHLELQRNGESLVVAAVCVGPSCLCVLALSC